MIELRGLNPHSLDTVWSEMQIIRRCEPEQCCERVYEKQDSYLYQ